MGSRVEPFDEILIKNAILWPFRVIKNEKEDGERDFWLLTSTFLSKF